MCVRTREHIHVCAYVCRCVQASVHVEVCGVPQELSTFVLFCFVLRLGLSKGSIVCKLDSADPTLSPRVTWLPPSGGITSVHHLCPGFHTAVGNGMLAT